MNQITVIIQAKNEEKNIRAALASCTFAQQVFIIDNFSTDQTASIVRGFANTHLTQREFDGYATQKNWALAHLPISTEWILFLDADEVIPRSLSEELTRIACDPSSADCWYVNRRFYFLGRWIKHGGWYPSWHLRFFRRGEAVYEQRNIDEHMIPHGTVGYLENDLSHEDMNGLERWIDKHNTYSSFHAKEIFSKNRSGFTGNLLSTHPVERKRALKIFFYRLPFRPLLRFFVMYVIQGGFLDGYQGFIFCALRAIQEFHINIKLKELKISFMKRV